MCMHRSCKGPSFEVSSWALQGILSEFMVVVSVELSLTPGHSGRWDSLAALSADAFWLCWTTC